MSRLLPQSKKHLCHVVLKTQKKKVREKAEKNVVKTIISRPVLEAESFFFQHAKCMCRLWSKVSAAPATF